LRFAQSPALGRKVSDEFTVPLGFGRAAVPRRTTLQSSDQIVVQITHLPGNSLQQ
jgi:hypothetical protein